MTKVITALLLMAALVMGAFLPEGYMMLLDQSLSEPVSTEMTESVLEPEVDLSVDMQELLKSRTVAYRLQQFQNGLSMYFNLGGEYEEDQIAVARAREFLRTLIEGRFVTEEVVTESKLVWFADDVVIRVRTVTVVFNEGWIARMTIDQDNSAILQFVLHNTSGMALHRLFPESEKIMSNAELVVHAEECFVECLENFLGEGEVAIQSTGDGRADVVFGDGEMVQNLPFMVEYTEGIYFNPEGLW